MKNISDKDRNLTLLLDIEKCQNEGDEDFVSTSVVQNARIMVDGLIRQPMIFRTFRNSLQMEFELEDKSYLEFEVFDDRVTCMLVPERKYEKAVFPKVTLDDIEGMNKIVGEFCGLV